MDKLLAELQLEAQATLPVSALSGGQHSRLQIGGALCCANPTSAVRMSPATTWTCPPALARAVSAGLARRLRAGFHDARLLDRVTAQTLILRDGQLQRFRPPSSQYAPGRGEMAAGLRRRADEQRMTA